VPFCGLIPALVLSGIGGIATCGAAIAVGLVFTLGLAVAFRNVKPATAGPTTRPATQPTSAPQIATNADPE